MDLQAALQKRFSPPEHALFFEVAPGTGAAARYADAVAMNLWPSRGLRISGFELKVDRRDWLRELKNPAKAEAIAKLCDEWWLVTTAGVVRDIDEIPTPWGWMELGGKKSKALRIKKKPEVRPGPELNGQVVLPRAFAASIIRRAHEFSQRRTELNLERDKAYKDGLKEGGSKTEWATEKSVLDSEIRFLKEQLKCHEGAQSAAGLGEYRSWELASIAREVALVRRISPGRIVTSYQNALRMLQATNEQLETALTQFQEETK